MACTLYWTVPQLNRLTDNPLPPTPPRFCMDMIGIHFVCCCFFSTHKSQANPQLASTTCQCVCVFGATAGVPRRRCSPRQLLPRRRLVFVLVPAVRVSAPSVSAKQPVSSAVRGCLVVVLSVCLIKLLNLTFSLYPT